MGEMEQLYHKAQDGTLKVQSQVENRQTKDFHDWFYRFLVERIKETF